MLVALSWRGLAGALRRRDAVLSGFRLGFSAATGLFPSISITSFASTETTFPSGKGLLSTGMELPSTSFFSGRNLLPLSSGITALTSSS